MLTVVCVKAPPLYDYRYVNRLHAAVSRNLTVPHRFLCFTDHSLGLRCSARNLPANLRGWWAKLYLHSPKLLAGRVLYLDLDTLIVGNLDFVDSYDGDFAILRDFYRPDGYGSGVMLWNKPQPQVWEEWVKAGRPDDPLGDQGWMEKKVDADLLQDVFPGKFVSYKVDCEKGVPEGASVVCFHGHPKNTDFPEDHWVTKTWKGEVLMA